MGFYIWFAVSIEPSNESLLPILAKDLGLCPSAPSFKTVDQMKAICPDFDIKWRSFDHDFGLLVSEVDSQWKGVDPETLDYEFRAEADMETISAQPRWHNRLLVLWCEASDLIGDGSDEHLNKWAIAFLDGQKAWESLLCETMPAIPDEILGLVGSCDAKGACQL